MIANDLKMPGKPGADLIDRARAEIERAIGFIVVSEHGSPGINSDGLDTTKYLFF